MKYYRGICLLLVLVTLCGSLYVAVYADETVANQPDASVTQGRHTLDAQSAYLGSQKLVNNIATAVMYEINSDTLMYSWRADDRIHPSSLVKIMTALIAVEKGDLKTVVTVPQKALDTVPYYAASADLVAGEEIPLSDLLYCMMVGSANDAAAVIAFHISGSEEAFVQEMNRYAKELGCKDTQFTNSHGLHDDNQYTTTRDLAKILAIAVRNEDFLTYFNTVHYEVPATNKSEVRELAIKNFLMNTDELDRYFDPQAKGGRTGTTEDGFHCLATLAESNGMQVICIVTGSQSTLTEDGRTEQYGSFAETSALLDTCFNGYQVAEVLYSGQVLKQLAVPGGENDVILSSQDSVYAVLPESATIADLNYKFTDNTEQIKAPIAKGAVLSKVEVWHGGFCIASADLVALNQVRTMPTQTPVEENGDEGLIKALIIIGSVIGGSVLILLTLRIIRRFALTKTNGTSRKFRRSRRRSQ